MARPGWRLEAICFCVLLLRSDQRSCGCKSMTITQFGRFRVDLHRRELLADGQSLSIGSRALDLLIVLLEARGKLVTKDELMSRVWPGTIVEENALQAQVSTIRKALGEDRDFIRTNARRGYRFVADITTHA